jgi:hypothetical protein
MVHRVSAAVTPPATPMAVEEEENHQQEHRGKVSMKIDADCASVSVAELQTAIEAVIFDTGIDPADVVSVNSFCGSVTVVIITSNYQAASSVADILVSFFFLVHAITPFLPVLVVLRCTQEHVRRTSQ